MKRLTEEEKLEIKRLTELKYSATQIAKKIKRGTNTIERFWRKEGMHSKYREVSDCIESQSESIKYDLFSGMPLTEISRKYSCSVNGIQRFMKRHNLERVCKTKTLTPFQEQFLIGTLLGDSSLIKSRKFCYYVCSHSSKQREYIDYKRKILESFNPHLYKRDFKKTRKDGSKMEAFSLTTKCFDCFSYLYDSFYVDGKKRIPIDLIETKFTEVSLAFLFMDDGSFYGSSIGISLCSFSEDELNSFILFLKRKFDLNFFICPHYNKYYDKYYNEIRLKTSDFQKFKSLISPYIQEWAKYKLGGS